MTVSASSAATVAAAQRFQAVMPDMGASLLATQAMAAPGELLNLSLNASAVLPEAAVLLAMIATLLVDLAGEKVATRWVPPICYIGLGLSLIHI